MRKTSSGILLPRPQCQVNQYLTRSLWLWVNWYQMYINALLNYLELFTKMETFVNKSIALLYLMCGSLPTLQRNVPFHWLESRINCWKSLAVDLLSRIDRLTLRYMYNSIWKIYGGKQTVWNPKINLWISNCNLWISKNKVGNQRIKLESQRIELEVLTFKFETQRIKLAIQKFKLNIQRFKLEIQRIIFEIQRIIFENQRIIFENQKIKCEKIFFQNGTNTLLYNLNNHK